MIQAVILDDEEIALKALEEKVKKYCPDIEVIKLFSNPATAFEEINQLNPDIVFLDIEMPRMNGFTFLKKLNRVNFEVIFTTAYSQYAIEALRLSALDFILKPIDPRDLINAVSRLKERLMAKNVADGHFEKQMQLYFHYQHSAMQIDKIAIPVMNGLEFINVPDIIKIRGENVYSVFYLLNGKTFVASLTLKETESMLTKAGFFRVHKSFIINLRHILRYIKGEGGVAVMTDGSEVEISRRNKADFLKRISPANSGGHHSER
jgi:two-component system, LytTR family, response regulator